MNPKNNLLLFCSLIAGSSAILTALPANAWDHYAVKALGPFDAKGIGLYTVDSATGSATLVGTRCDLDPSPTNVCYQQVGENSGIDSVTSKFVLENANGDFISFDPSTGNWTNEGTAWTSSYTASYARPTVSGNGSGAVKVEVGGLKIYERKATGEIHIGENSLIIREKNGVEELYAKDADGNAIPINITNGSDFQINGRSVQGEIDQNIKDINNNNVAISTNKADISTNKADIKSNRSNINNLGFGVAGATALSTAMTALPTVADDSPVSCGVGSGGYSNRYAMSVGCAFKTTDRLSFNAGGSYVFGGAADYGSSSLSNVAGRAGFVFKLGEIQKPSIGSVEQLQSQLNEVKEKNKAIQSENASIRAQNQELMTRLERLEEIALSNKLPMTTDN